MKQIVRYKRLKLDAILNGNRIIRQKNSQADKPTVMNKLERVITKVLKSFIADSYTLN